ncbi:autophagy-related protein 101 isoform X2 [Lagopus leucura]|uniref:autophagy-related protein 101 isoform X2 n=1 Tax=Lagopus leucura TaxID=30410 RepID=UPI001C67CBE5|nr:autophagy-related protein 101 isoform X2 [Lagopus leucura]
MEGSEGALKVHHGLVGSEGASEATLEPKPLRAARPSSRSLLGWALAPCRPQDALRSSGSDGMGQISLEFYQKKKSRWPFSDECIPWELWTIKVNVVNLANEQERQICREKSEVDNVFDTSLKDVQPYLYKISYQITDALGSSVTTTMRRLIKDTLAL